MFCVQCGSENIEGATYCAKCGEDLTKQTPPERKSGEDVRPSDSMDEGKTYEGSEVFSDDFEPGSLFANRYEILDEGKKGGMGAVYKCRDTKLNETVALKVIHSRLLNSEHAVSRFRQEVAISRKLHHKNIVEVHNLEEWDGKEYFTMEWVEGVTLREIIEKRKKDNKPFSLEEASKIITQLSDALHYAHKYTIHRDIKPENILVVGSTMQDAGYLIDETLQTKLTDFGIAKMLSPSEFTSTSIQMGTPYYMAPEQKMDAASVDKRADIYALGVVLFELLTLENAIGLELPSEINQALPKELDGVIKKAVATRPEHRYDNTSELFSSVNEILTAGGEGVKVENHLTSKSNGEIEQPEVVSSYDFVDADHLMFEPEMVLVEGGKFKMGDLFGVGLADEKPVHTVRLDKFYIGKYPVTFDEYDAYCEATGADKPDDCGWGRGRRPVINVCWHDAKEYLTWLVEQTGEKYRLPTEAEWEYAARSGGKKEKYVGDNYWFELNLPSITHTVGEKKPNGLGLYDMCGNVRQWCSDWYDDDYYGWSPRNNPKGPTTGAVRVFRGGSFSARGNELRRDIMGWTHVTSIGFRCARNP